MAGLTGYRAVPTGKFKFRVAIMIEFGFTPLLFAMTFAAFVTEPSRVNIIGTMAVATLHRNILEPLSGMTAVARHPLMRAAQGKPCLCMIEFFLGLCAPAVYVVALFTLIAQLSLVRIRTAMTPDAFMSCFPVFFLGEVTAGATYLLVSALERVIGLLVSKCSGVQHHDVDASSLVIRMAASAFETVSSLKAAMKSAACGNVGINLVVTVSAKSALGLLVRRVVTFLALILKLCVPLDQFAGHHKTLQPCSLGKGDVPLEAGHGGRQQSNNRNASEAPMSDSSRHAPQ